MSSPVASRLACLFSAALAGCASTYPTHDGPPPRDFSVAGAAHDMAAGGVGGNGGSGGTGGSGGAGGAGGSGGGMDLAAPQLPVADMAPPADLMPACAPSIADDAGIAPGLHLVAPGPGHMLFAARFDGKMWTPIDTTAGPQIADVALAVPGSPARPLVLARMSDAELFAASYDGCRAQYPALAQIRSDAWTALRPAVVAGPSGADVVFRGGFDDKLYWSHFDGSAFSAIVTDGNLHSSQIPTALYVGGALHTIYNNAAQNQAIYDGTVQAAGGAAAALTGTTSYEPAAVSLGSDAIVVFTGQNEHVYWFKASAPGTTLHDLCDGQQSCYILAEAAPALALGSDGSVVCIFRGTDHHLYSSSLPRNATTWTAVLPVTGTMDTTTLAVAIAPGLDGAVAEAVYVRAGDGYARHARLSGGAWQVSTVAPIALTGAAAIAVSP